jgi:hypothetical protein
MAIRYMQLVQGCSVSRDLCNPTVSTVRISHPCRSHSPASLSKLAGVAGYWDLGCQGGLGLIFASVMTYYRCCALSVSRKLVLPDRARYTAVWATIFAADGAGVLAVEAAASRLATRSLADAAAAFAPPPPRCAGDSFRAQEVLLPVAPPPMNAVRQFNRRRSSRASAPHEEEEEDCSEPGALDPANPVDSLDQLYAQAFQHARPRAHAHNLLSMKMRSTSHASPR